jgi:hypothetical protein
MTLSFFPIRSLFNSLSARLSTFCSPLFLLPHLVICAEHPRALSVPFTTICVLERCCTVTRYREPLSIVTCPLLGLPMPSYAAPCLINMWRCVLRKLGKNCVAKNFSWKYHNVQARFLDAMTLVQRFGKPHYFVSITCYPY